MVRCCNCRADTGSKCNQKCPCFKAKRECTNCLVGISLCQNWSKESSRRKLQRCVDSVAERKRRLGISEGPKHRKIEPEALSQGALQNSNAPICQSSPSPKISATNDFQNMDSHFRDSENDDENHIIEMTQHSIENIRTKVVQEHSPEALGQTDIDREMTRVLGTTLVPAQALDLLRDCRCTTW